MRRHLLIVGLTILAGTGGAASLAHGVGQLGTRAFSGSIEHPAIGYAERPTTDPVSGVIRQIADGKLQPAFDNETGYLRPLLTALDVPIDSQVLVFTRTGIQGSRTGPTNPRALYFNDSVVVGYIRGAFFLELASQDPQQGVLFHVNFQGDVR